MVTLRNVCILTMSSVGMVAVGRLWPRGTRRFRSSAQLVAEDKGTSDFVAPSDGEVFVEDRSANKLLYSGKIDEGDRLAGRPDEGPHDDQRPDGPRPEDPRPEQCPRLLPPDPRADVAGRARRAADPGPADAAGARPAESEIIVQPRTGQRRRRYDPGEARPTEQRLEGHRRAGRAMARR